ncbi:hypothetical protein [Streptomyces qinzhouensis]|uniref:Uncharacterized protein n=1 Tax=Streptomyces qinzhouensis TaxID=2599401 RepID=A0A5B8IRF6_9ACTN|nr:hypothetical protein [Streptomyces qinzhouensis]QDY81162.1 hypothetical protein FQU76_19550 [Streptomyces qinzhouensis]
MAFSADELRVLRRALAVALHPVPLADEDIQDCLRLADSVDEAAREAGRLRAFLLADLDRYRAALPGATAGYLELLQDALAAGYDPRPEDLAALRGLRGHIVAEALLDRCRILAERSVRARLAGRRITAPAPRTRLLALPGGRTGATAAAGADEGAEEKPAPRPKPQPAPKPAPEPAAPPAPGERPVPKPSEVFPPRRRPVPPPGQLATA